MKLTNIISVVGLIVAAFFSYSHFYLGTPGPTYYPLATNTAILGVFCISYLLSLFEAKTTFGRVFAISIIFAGFIGTAMFSVLVMLGKAVYPSVFGVSGAYIEGAIFLLLMIQWNRQK